MRSALLALLSVLPFLPCCQAPSENRGYEYLDAHIHLWDIDVQKNLKQWPGEDNKVLYRTFLPEHYLAESRPLGITQTVLLQRGEEIEEIRWAIGISELYADDFPAIVFRMETRIGQDSFETYYAEASKSGRFKGIRLTGGVISPKNASRDGVIRDLKRLAHDNRSLDLLPFGCQLEDIAALAEDVPDLRIMVNAMGLRGEHKRTPHGPTEAWIADMRLLARYKNIMIKLTGQTMRGVPGPHNPDHFQPYYDELLEIFGPKRLVWASNWPTLLNSKETLAMTIENPKQILAERSNEDRRAIFQDNAARFYDLSCK